MWNYEKGTNKKIGGNYSCCTSTGDLSTTKQPQLASNWIVAISCPSWNDGCCSSAVTLLVGGTAVVGGTWGHINSVTLFCCCSSTSSVGNDMPEITVFAGGIIPGGIIPGGKLTSTSSCPVTFSMSSSITSVTFCSTVVVWFVSPSASTVSVTLLSNSTSSTSVTLVPIGSVVVTLLGIVGSCWHNVISSFSIASSITSSTISVMLVSTGVSGTTSGTSSSSVVPVTFSTTSSIISSTDGQLASISLVPWFYGFFTLWL